MCSQCQHVHVVYNLSTTMEHIAGKVSDVKKDVTRYALPQLGKHMQDASGIGHKVGCGTGAGQGGLAPTGVAKKPSQ